MKGKNQGRARSLLGKVPPAFQGISGLEVGKTRGMNHGSSGNGMGWNGSGMDPVGQHPWKLRFCGSP